MIDNRKPISLVSQSVLDQINIANASLEEDPRFCMLRKHSIYHFLKKEAAKHSVALEYPNGKKVRKGRARKLAQDNLCSANSFFSRNFDGDLNERLIMDTATLIEPSLGPVISYRSERDAMVMAKGLQMVYPSNVAERMEGFVAENNCLADSIEQAVHAHFHIARIHPFRDGNGRLARLAQNGILDYTGLPSIIIEPFERKDYMDLINAAQVSYKEHGKLKSEQSRFYNYLAMKLHDSLTEAKKRLSQ